MRVIPFLPVPAPTTGRYHGRTAENSDDDGRDGGQVMILIVGYAVLTLLVLTVVMAVSAVYIQHKKLLSVADSAAVAASDAFGLGQVAGGSSVPTPALSNSSVKGAVAKHLEQTGAAGRFDSLAIASATGAPDGRTAHVVLSAVAHPPIINFLVPAGIEVVAVSNARPQLGR